MSGLNILITTSYYWPENAGSAPYLAGLAVHLQERGHRVVVATGYPHYPEWRLPEGARLARTDWHGSVRVRRRWHYVPRRQTASHRLLYEGTLFALGLTALPLRSRPDVVIGTCPSLAGGALAAVAARVYRVPYALVFQDLMGQAARQSGMPGGARVARAVGNAELALARNATAVGVIAEGFRPYLERGGVQPERVHRLRNWTRRVEPTESVAETRLRLGWRDDEFVCLHGGNLGRKQGLDNLVDTAALLRDEKIRIVLAGDGNDRERLETRARELALDRLQFVELQTPGRWESVMAASDVLLVNQRAAVTDMSLPSKLTSYFAAGRPVVAAASVDSETAREIDAAGAGLVVPPDDPQRLREAILAVKADPAAVGELGACGRRYAERVLFPEVVLADYDRFLEVVADAGRGGALPLPATH
jgi:putative colanic acid biosynthesis glycosyltransferase WcaI